MTRFFLAALVILSTASAAMFAQDDRIDGLGFEETVLPDESADYFAVGVGPVVSAAFLPLDDLNALFGDNSTPISGKMSTPFVLVGLEAFTGTKLFGVGNMRLGFSWVNGSSTLSNTINDITHESEYSVSSSTIHLDYGLMLTKSLAVLPGVGFGWGTQTISTYSGPKTADWTQTHPNNTTGLSNFAFTELHRNVLCLQPRVNIEYAVTRLICLRAGGGFVLGLSDNDWVGNRITTVNNVPSGLKISGAYAQFGLFVGLFN